jgi:topoisomerase-4 subunit A
MVIFSAADLPEMARGKGVRLQKYKDGGVSDARVFSASEGLSWTDSSGRTFVKQMSELREWVGERAQAGRQPPQGFPRNNRFTG